MRPARIGVWPTLPVRAYARSTAEVPPFPLADPRCRLFARGRVGLFHALRSLPPGEILVPAYHHGSEVEAILRAGHVPRFYGGTAPDPDELDSLRNDSTRALQVVHTLGFPQDAPRWRAWCDERGLLLVEDAAQSWLATIDSRPVGTWGDISLFCLYKSFGLPDGAAVVADWTEEPQLGGGRLGVVPLLRRHASRELGRYDVVEALVRRSRRGARPDELAFGDPSAAPSTVTLRLLGRVAAQSAADARRHNYARLLEELGELVPDAFRRLPAGAAPFAFPVETDDKDALIRRLDSALVTPLDFWSVPHPALPVDGFPHERRLRERVVGLPVHQDLTETDLGRIATAVRRRRRLAPRVELVRADTFDDLRPEWDAVAASGGNVFGTPEWHETWWRHFARGSLRLTACRARDGRLLGVLPLYLWRERPLRVLRFLGHGPGDVLGPVAAPAEAATVTDALVAGLDRGFWDWDVAVMEQVRCDEPLAQELRERVVRRTGYPILRLDTTWEEYLAGRSANFRQGLRRKRRRLEERHEVRFRLADEGSLDRDLTTLFRLHDERWRGVPSPFTPRAAFHREFARLAFDRGWLRLWLLELDGDVAAAWLGFRYGSSDAYYQAGRDPRWDDASVGTLLLAHTIRDAFEAGRREYHFLRGDEQYKYGFATEDPGLAILARTRGLRGRSALVAAEWLFRRPRLRERVRRAADA